MKFCIDDSCFTCSINLLEVIRDLLSLSLHSSLQCEVLVTFCFYVVCLVQFWFYFVSFLHPKKQADHGGSAPYWLGLSSFSSSWPVRRHDLSHHRLQSMAPLLHANWDRLIICNNCHPCCVNVPLNTDVMSLCMVQCRGISMEILGCPSVKIPLLAFLMLSRGKQSNTLGIRLATGVARRIAKLQSDRLRGSTPVFSFGIDSFCLSYLLGDHKVVVLFDP